MSLIAYSPMLAECCLRNHFHLHNLKYLVRSLLAEEDH